MIFIVPLQGEIDTMSLPADAAVQYSKMSSAQWESFGKVLPLQVLALHGDPWNVNRRNWTSRYFLTCNFTELKHLFLIFLDFEGVHVKTNVLKL